MRTRRSPIFRNGGDETTRELERAYEADPSRDALGRLMRAYARSGRLRQMWVAAVAERQAAADAVWGAPGDVLGTRIPGQAEREIMAVHAEAMTALRAADPRVRQSRRRDLPSLSQWAGQVVGPDRVAEIVKPFEERALAIAKAAQARLTAAKARLAELAYYARPEPGPVREWDFHGESHRYGEEGVARQRAINKVRLARQLGLEARLERRPGELVRGMRRGDGWATFVGVQNPADLKLIQELHELRSKLSHERYEALRREGIDILRADSVFDAAYAEIDRDLGLPPALPLERQLELEANTSVAQAHKASRLAP